MAIRLSIILLAAALHPSPARGQTVGTSENVAPNFDIEGAGACMSPAQLTEAVARQGFVDSSGSGTQFTKKGARPGQVGSPMIKVTYDGMGANAAAHQILWVRYYPPATGGARENEELRQSLLDKYGEPQTHTALGTSRSWAWERVGALWAERLALMARDEYATLVLGTMTRCPQRSALPLWKAGCVRAALSARVVRALHVDSRDQRRLRDAVLDCQLFRSLVAARQRRQPSQIVRRRASGTAGSTCECLLDRLSVSSRQEIR